MRALRKHRLAWLAIVVYNFVLFFPVCFMGRAVSPNDVFDNYPPWSLYKRADVQNSLLNDPPTAYFTLISLLKHDKGAFHWNPFIASGVPGFGSSAAAVLSPFIAIPTLLFPLTWVYTAILFLKLNVPFWCAYQWLREERLGKRGAAIGALVAAGAGVYAVRWLWQLTNATALYPALLWLVRRAFNGKRNAIWLTAIVALAYALAGFPATMAYGAYLCAAYAAYLLVERGRPARLPGAGAGRPRSGVIREVGKGLAAVLIALAIASPSLVPFVQLVRRSGYLEVREQATLQQFYPRSHWRSFVDPQRLGNNAYKNWHGDPALGIFNNFVEATIYVGLLSIPLALFALLARRARSRWFWLAALLVLLAAIFNVAGVPRVLAPLPGIKYSSMTRVALALPIPVAYLAAAGASWLLATIRRRRVLAAIAGGLIVVALAGDLALFAGRFYPYHEPHDVRVPATPTIAFLRAQPGPFRVAPFFNYMWPNSAELFRIEDVRSHFSSEATYRRMMQRIDPSSWGGPSTVIQFNSLHFNFKDPLLGMLGVRYYVEQRNIDIVKWTIFAATSPGTKERGATTLLPGRTMQRTVQVAADPFWAIELPATMEATFGAKPRLDVVLIKDGRAVWQRAFTPGDVNAINKIYVPLRPYARRGEVVTLRVTAVNAKVSLPTGDAPPGESPLFYGRVATPVIFDRELPDGRIFRNLAEVPRFHPVSRVRRMGTEELLARTDFDFAEEAIVAPSESEGPGGAGGATVLMTYHESEQRIATNASAPFLLASSEKLTPELRIFIDGKPARAIGINALFAGVEVPAGKHTVVYQRRIGRGWWPIAALGALALAVTLALRR